MSEFVHEALRERVNRLRRDEIRRRIESAAGGPLFVEDVRETTQAYGPIDKEGLETESIVMAHQIRTISRHRIKRRAARVESPVLQQACLETDRIHLGMY